MENGEWLSTQNLIEVSFRRSNKLDNGQWKIAHRPDEMSDGSTPLLVVASRSW